MLTLISHPRTSCMTLAIANMFTPLMRRRSHVTRTYRSLSGVNMFAMARSGSSFFGWDINVSILLSQHGGCICCPGGLRSAIFNEVLQFFLIWAGALLIPILGLYEAGGMHNLKLLIAQRASAQYVHLWSGLGSSRTSMGIQLVGIVFGLAPSFQWGYWTTDFFGRAAHFVRKRYPPARRWRQLSAPDSR